MNPIHWIPFLFLCTCLGAKSNYLNRTLYDNGRKLPSMSLESVSSSLVSIGSCSKFAILAGSVANFENALTVVKTGSVGNFPGTSITGNYRLIGGTVQSATVVAHACANDMFSSAKNASKLSCTYTLPNSLLSGTLYSGVYCSAPGTFSITLQTTIYLDAQNVSSAAFIFRAATTVIAGYYSSIILINGAQASNVYWYIGSSATIGYSTNFVGQMIAEASITIGQFALLNGRALAHAAVTFQGGSSVDPAAIYGHPNVSLGTSKNFVIFAGTSITFGTARTILSRGSIGVYPGSTVSGNYTIKLGTVQYANTVASQAAQDLSVAYNTASTATCQYYLATGDLSGITLTTGVYCSASGAFSIGQLSYLTLNGQNVNTTNWLFQTATTVTTGADSSVILKNGALSSNVYWAVGSSVSIGYSSFFLGNIMAFSSITFAPYAVFDGRALTAADVTFSSYSAASSPYGTSVVVYPANRIHLGSCSSFSVFAGTFVLFSSALSIIYTGSIGTSPGTSITGNYKLTNGIIQSATPVAKQCNVDLTTAYTVASGFTCTTTLPVADLAGLNLYPGVYCTVPATLAISASGSVSFDALNNTNALFVLQSSTTVITGTRSAVLLRNKASASNIFWAIGTAATLGTSSYFVGQL